MNLVQALYLNNKVKPFDNEKVRQALCYAVVVQSILDLTEDGHGTNGPRFRHVPRFHQVL